MNKNRDTYILFFILIAFFIVSVVYLSFGWLDIWGDGLGIITAAAITLAMYSFLYKDNPVFKIAENIFVGVAMGYSIIIVWYNILKPDVFEALIMPVLKDTGNTPQYSVIIPTLLGLFMFFRFSSKMSWLSRWSFAFIVGMGAGIAIPNFINAILLRQLEPMFDPLYTGSFWGTINTSLVLIGVVSVLFYFFFSMEHKGVIGGASVVGIWFLMIAFGASFGYTVMARMSLLIGRIQFLLKDWLGIIQ